MLAALLLLATIALIVLKAAGILAISWFVALIPALVLLVFGLVGVVIAAVMGAFLVKDL